MPSRAHSEAAKIRSSTYAVYKRLSRNAVSLAALYRELVDESGPSATSYASNMQVYLQNALELLDGEVARNPPAYLANV